MKKLIQKITSTDMKWQLLIGAAACVIFFSLRSVFSNEGVDSLWGSNLIQWMSIPFLLLAVATFFYVLYIKVEKKETLVWQQIIAAVLSTTGLLLFFLQ